MIPIANIIAFCSTTLFFLLLAGTSILEKEKRATFIAICLTLANILLWGLFILASKSQLLTTINNGTLLLLGIFIIISLVKIFPKRILQDFSKVIRFDERDHMFSRNNLQHHPDLAEQYYRAHPDKKEIDEEIQAKPELGEPGQTYYDKYYSPLFIASDTYLSRTRSASMGKPTGSKAELDSEKMSEAIKQMAKFYGADDVGITVLKPYQLYSHTGRWKEVWGKKVETSHRYAIVIAGTMNVPMLKHAPTLPAVLESTRLYVEMAKIANILAQYIRQQGYEARAHTDGNYEVLGVPLAIACGMGELGRMGIFMHHTWGPCLRLAVVTTEMELLPDQTEKPYYIEEFCQICKKCAENCPTQSISSGAPETKRGCDRWTINMEKCFSFWKNVGTDCGFCISVCPYTKPNTLLHKLVRFYISRNKLNQKIALFFDDTLYGRKKKIKSLNPKKPIIPNGNG